MKKDNFNNETSTNKNTGNDMSSLLNVFKMLSSNRDVSTSHTSENERVASSPANTADTPASQDNGDQLSRTTQRILALMDEHDKAMKRIDERHNK